MTQDREIYEIKADLLLLKQQVTNFDKYFGKLDSTIEKISTLMEQTNKMLAIHEERIANQLKDTDEIETESKERHIQQENTIIEFGKTVNSRFEIIGKRITKLEMARYAATIVLIIVGSIGEHFIDAYFTTSLELHSDRNVIQRPVSNFIQDKPAPRIERTKPSQ